MTTKRRPSVLLTEKGNEIWTFWKRSGLQEPGWCSVRSSTQIRPGSAGAFGAALLFVAVASVARWGVGLLDPESAPYLTYFPAVLLATIVGGSGTGAFAAVLGGMVGGPLTPPHFAHLPLRFGQEIIFSIYLLVALLFVFSADHYRRIAKHRQDPAERLQDEGELA